MTDPKNPDQGACAPFNAQSTQTRAPETMSWEELVDAGYLRAPEPPFDGPKAAPIQRQQDFWSRN